MTQKQYQELCKILGIDTLKERKRDRLDFNDLAVWTLQKALDRAYDMGKEDA